MREFDARVAGETRAGALQHFVAEVESDARRLRIRGEHERERDAVTGTEIEHAFDRFVQQFDQHAERLRAMRERVARREIRERVISVDPKIRAHGPTSLTARTSSPRACRRTILLTALRYARADASTTSVATPRPVTRRLSASTVTVTAPSASDPPVTDETWKLRSVPETPVALEIASIAASIMPSPLPLASTLPSLCESTTRAVGRAAVPPCNSIS